MGLDWGYFRQLYEGLYDHDDLAGRRRFLSGRQPTAAEHMADLAPLRKRERIPTGDDEHRWRIIKLYALSRVSDQLIASFAPADTWLPDADALAVHAEFFSGIGLVPFEHADAFSPFHHEVFAVTEDPDATSVTVKDVLWPGFWFGDLLFSRAGVRVRAPRHLIDATVATTSTLYFTHRRGHRPTSDLSHGWGSNSQWRTSFARFYADDEGLHFNWDGETDIGVDPPAHSPGRHENEEDPLQERRQLLLHRCFVRDPHPADEDDRFPFRDRISLTTAEWPVRPESIVHVPWTR